MIDTNQVQQIAETANAVKLQLQPWIPAIGVGAAWLVKEIGRTNGWLEYVAGKIIAHGGIIKLIVKLFWNSGDVAANPQTKS